MPCFYTKFVLLSLTVLMHCWQDTCVLADGGAPTLSCSRCDADKFYSGDSCQPCMLNSKTTGLPPQISITDCFCNAGYTEVNNGDPATPETATCEACALGTFKPDELSDDACTLCTAHDLNTHTDARGKIEQEDCVCNAGYTRFNTEFESDLCQQCVAGKYKDGLGDQECTSCPSNAYSPVGSAQFADCYCNAGYTHDSGDPATSDLYSASDVSNVCSACAAGKYRDGDMLPIWPSFQYLCEDCPYHTYNVHTGSTSESACTVCSGSGADETFTVTTGRGSDEPDDCVCQAGYAGDKTSGNIQSCTICAAGSYAEGTGQVLCDECTAGKHLSGEGSSSQSDCLACSAGKFSGFDGAAICDNCGNDEYQDGTGSTGCKTCPTSSGHPENGQVAEAACLCNAGYTSFESGVGCVECAAGKYKVDQINADCTDCPADSSSTAASDELSDCFCDAGFISSGTTPCLDITPMPSDCSHLAADKTCVPCPENHYCHPDLDVGGMPDGIATCRSYSTSEIGSDDSEDCDCNAGYYQPTVGGSCVPCRDSSTEDPAEDPPRGYYCPAKNDNAIPCGAHSGTHSSAGEFPSSFQDCVCLAGRWRNCVPDPDSTTGFTRHTGTYNQDSTEITEDCNRDAVYWTSNCELCDVGDVCLLEQTMEHCPVHATSDVGSDAVADCKCNAGYKPSVEQYYAR